MPGLDLRATLALDGSAFEAGFNKIKNHLGTLFTVGAIAAFTREVIANAASFQDLSEQYGITTKEVQQLSEAAKEGGLEFEQFGQALIKIGRARKEALGGKKEMQQFFALFGIGEDALRSGNVRSMDILKTISGALNGMEIDPETRIILDDLMGKRGEKLAAILADLSNTKVAIISDEDIKRIDELDDSLTRLWANVKAKSAPVIAELSSMLADVIKDIGELPIQKGVAPIGALPGFLNISPDNLNIISPPDISSHGKMVPFADLGYVEKKPDIGGLFEKEKDQKEVRMKSFQAGDSLVRVGNFLGASRDSISRIGERTNQLLTQIERNTRRSNVTNAANSDSVYE